MNGNRRIVVVMAGLLALGGASLVGCTLERSRSHATRVLVFGGTGMLGSEIVRALVARGDAVSVFVRAGSNRTPLAGFPVEYVVGDVLEPATLKAALGRGRYAVVVSAIARTDHDQPASGTTIYATGNDAITRACLAAHVTQVIQIGTVGSGDSAALVPPKVREFARVVFEDKTQAEHTLIASGLHYTIVRTGTLLVGAASGTGILSEDHTILGPMRIGELGRVVAACVANRACYDRIYHATDPSIPPMTTEELDAARHALGNYKQRLRSPTG